MNNQQEKPMVRSAGAGGAQEGQGAGLARGVQQQPYFPSTAEFLANPFAAMRRMHEDMDQLFAQALGGVGGGLMAGGASGLGIGSLRSGMQAWSPAIEVKQQGNDLVVCAELPGMKPEEVQVELHQNELVIQGERRQEESSTQGGIHRTERRYGRFYRAIPLPEGVNAEQAQARFQNGMLEVTVPLPQQQQSRRRQIPVMGGPAQHEAGSASISRPDASAGEQIGLGPQQGTAGEGSPTSR